MKLPRLGMAFTALLTAIVIAGCGSSGATWPPTGSGAPGTGSAGGAPTVNPEEPSTVIDHVIAGAMGLASGDRTITSFHIKIALDGTIDQSALEQAAGSSSSMVTGDLVLDGTSIEGDVDVANQAAHMTLNVPAIDMLKDILGSQPIVGELIVKGDAMYFKVNILGMDQMWTKVDAASLTSSLGGLTGGLPISVPSPDASALTTVEQEVADFRQQLKDAGAETTLVGLEQIGGKDAYHINISVPLAMINDEIAAAASPGPAPMTIDSASVDVWAYKDTFNLAQVQVKGASSGFGSLGLTVTVTKYNEPVTIDAPSPSEVQTMGPLG